jgi:hypothetical protein
MHNWNSNGVTWNILVLRSPHALLYTWASGCVVFATNFANCRYGYVLSVTSDPQLTGFATR